MQMGLVIMPTGTIAHFQGSFDTTFEFSLSTPVMRTYYYFLFPHTTLQKIVFYLRYLNNSLFTLCPWNCLTFAPIRSFIHASGLLLMLSDFFKFSLFIFFAALSSPVPA